MKKLIRKLEKTNKRQEEVLLKVREQLRKREVQKAAEQKRKVEQNTGAKESKYAAYDVVLEEKETAEDSVIETLEEKVEEFHKLNQKQKKLIQKLKMQADEQGSAEPNMKFLDGVKRFLKKAGETIVKALPKLLDTAVKVTIGKVFSINWKRNKKGAVA